MVTITTTTTTEPTMSIILRKTTSISQRVNSVPTGSDRPLVGALDQATSVAGDHFPSEDLLQVQVWARDHPGHPPSKPSGRLWGAHWGARGGWLELKGTEILKIVVKVRVERGQTKTCGQRSAHRTQGRIRNTHGLRNNLGDHNRHANGERWK